MVETDVIYLPNGLKLKSALAHDLVFKNGLVLKANQEMARYIKAKPVEKVLYKMFDYAFVQTGFEGEPEVQAFINEELDKKGTIYATSIIGVAAYDNVVSPIVTPETARSPPPEKRVFLYKWNTRVLNLKI